MNTFDQTIHLPKDDNQIYLSISWIFSIVISIILLISERTIDVITLFIFSISVSLILTTFLPIKTEVTMMDDELEISSVSRFKKRSNRLLINSEFEIEFYPTYFNFKNNDGFLGSFDYDTEGKYFDLLSIISKIKSSLGHLVIFTNYTDKNRHTENIVNDEVDTIFSSNQSIFQILLYPSILLIGSVLLFLFIAVPLGDILTVIIFLIILLVIFDNYLSELIKLRDYKNKGFVDDFQICERQLLYKTEIIMSN